MKLAKNPGERKMDGSHLRACVHVCVFVCDVGSTSPRLFFPFQRLCIPEKDFRSMACTV